MLQYLNKLQYCYDSLVSQIPVGLLLYSHIPTALAALIFGTFIMFKAKNLQSKLLFAVSLFFALWCFADLSSWFAFLGSSTTMFTWSLVDLFSLIFFLLSYYFLYVFITERDLPVWQKCFGLIILAPTAVWTFLGSNLLGFDGNYCEAVENNLVTNYLFCAEAIVFLAVVVLTIYQYRKNQAKDRKREILFAGIGVSIFLGIFLAATWLASVLVNYEAWADHAYNYEIYGLFGMPIMLMYLGYLIVRYKAFDVKVFGAQALVAALLLIIASQFLFITTFTNRVLNSVSLLLALVFGLSLIRSVKREVLLREDLQVANKGQATLIHFINHQIKGFLNKGKIVFNELLTDSSYGTVNESGKSMLETGQATMVEGVDFVQQILKAADIEKGTFVYNMEKLDLKGVVTHVADEMKSVADTKGLQYNVEVVDGNYNINGDETQMKEAVRNLISNSIAYTPTGSIDIKLTTNNGKALFTIKDTGVGLSDEVKPKLFTKGGRSVESQKINVNSTGYGLAIVKGIVEAHKGRVWAESAGEGKGSTFSMELPLV